MKVRKRDGKVQGFDLNKPIHALEKVYKNGVKKEVPNGLIEKFTESIRAWLESMKEDVVDIETVQDFLRDFFMSVEENEAA